jgi:glycosidase
MPHSPSPAAPPQTPAWVADAVFYQIFPDRFASSPAVAKPRNLEPWDAPPTALGFKGGDFAGITGRLDYLRDLGFNAIYLTPVFASTANHRYHTFDYFQIDPILGGNKAFERFLRAAHDRGLRVVLDGVFNHASRGFYQFNHTLENGAASPFLDWFHFDERRLARGEPLNAYEPMPMRALPPSTEGGLERLGYRAWWDLAALPKLNFACRAVRDFILDVAEHWIRLGVDGWRLDVANEIDADFWPEFRSRVKAANPEAYICGEIWGQASEYLQGDMFDAVMNYLFGKTVLAFALGASLRRDVVDACGGYRDVQPIDAEAYRDRIDHIVKLYAPSIARSQMNLLGSHDTPRLISMAGGDEAAVKLALFLLFTFPGAPCIYYGDEIGLEGGHDPDCRRGFPWDESRWNKGLQAYIKELIALRRDMPALRHGSYKSLYAAEGVYVFERRSGRQVTVCAVNTSDEPRRLSIPVEGAAAVAFALPPRASRLTALQAGVV